MTALDDPTGGFTLSLPVTIRQAEQTDVDKLEWFGQFTHFRRLIHRAYQEQVRGRRLMLVADVNGFPVAQIFVQFAANNRRIADGHSRAYLYSFRVFALFQRKGIGTHLMAETEAILRERGFRWATIAVAKDNDGALRLYQRLGFRQIGEDSGNWEYVDDKGIRRQVHEPCWVLEKAL
jgi:ribosomal protein S18 acetylase RimI-like enzyme